MPGSIGTALLWIVGAVFLIIATDWACGAVNGKPFNFTELYVSAP